MRDTFDNSEHTVANKRDVLNSFLTQSGSSGSRWPMLGQFVIAHWGWFAPFALAAIFGPILWAIW